MVCKLLFGLATTARSIGEILGFAIAWLFCLGSLVGGMFSILLFGGMWLLPHVGPEGIPHPTSAQSLKFAFTFLLIFAVGGVYLWIWFKTVGKLAANPLAWPFEKVKEEKPAGVSRIKAFFLDYCGGFLFAVCALPIFVLMFGYWAPGLEPPGETAIHFLFRICGTMIVAVAVVVTFFQWAENKLNLWRAKYGLPKLT